MRNLLQNLQLDCFPLTFFHGKQSCDRIQLWSNAFTASLTTQYDGSLVKRKEWCSMIVNHFNFGILPRGRPFFVYLTNKCLDKIHINL